ncbi:MAG: ATP synthase F0 subunit B [Polyangiaceae bacterium]|nr:ATP synthase F0 subunit B [Polyangiaceae bacterium]
MQPGQPGMQPRPVPRPGMQPGNRPGMPPGMPPGTRPQPQPVKPPPPADHGGHGAGGHCPGHGPMDSPHAPNWWQGIIGVNNDKAQFAKDDHGHFHRTDGALTQLLWRYENAKDECDPKNQPPPFLASVLNFGLLAFVIYRFGKKPLSEALANRKKTLMQEIDNATRIKTEAEARLEDYEDKLQNLDDALEQMKKDFAQQSETERKHILAEAEERRVRMKRDVEFRLAQEEKAAKQRLLQEAVERAVAAAEEILKKKVQANDHDRLADDYLSGLDASWKGEATASRDLGGAA